MGSLGDGLGSVIHGRSLQRRYAHATLRFLPQGRPYRSFVVRLAHRPPSAQAPAGERETWQAAICNRSHETWGQIAFAPAKDTNSRPSAEDLPSTRFRLQVILASNYDILEGRQSRS